MANALTDFTKKREFLVCMDSDGCVMNTVRIKHTTVMCPELIRVFALDEQADFITAAWDEINLHTITRGISRFESVRLVFDRLKNRGIEISGSEDIAAWVDTATELSTASLQRELQKTGSLALRKLQEWNNACNRRIQALEPTFEPFPGVEESLRQLHAVADVAVVSAAKEQEALETEVGRCIMGQSRFSEALLSRLIDEKAAERKQLQSKVAALEMEIKSQSTLTANVSTYYDRFMGWSAEFRLADIDRKRMIVSQLYSRI